MFEGSKRYQTYLIVGMVVAIVLGVVIGLSHYNPAATEPEAVTLLGINLGELGTGFITLLKFIVVPLVVTSMIVGVTSLGSTANLGRMGGKTIAYYVVTTAISVTIGLIVVNIIVPGTFIEQNNLTESRQYPAKSVGDIAETFLPWNLVAGAMRGDILSLIFCSIFVGWVMLTLGEKVSAVVRFFNQSNQIIMRAIAAILLLAPFGVLGIVASKVGEKGIAALTSLAPYFFTVLIGLALHAFVVLPLILKLVGRRKVLPYAADVSPALTLAFASASSSATLPVTMECVEERAGVDKKASDFVLPLGATVNMDGTALYEAVAVMTIAQSLGMDLSIAEQVVVFLTATLAAVGAAGIPEAGLVMMVVVLKAVGIDPIHIGAIFAIDWFLDRFRTTVNVWGDSVGAAVIARLTGSKPTE